MNFRLLWSVLALPCAAAGAVTPCCPYARVAVNLDGKWNAIVDPYDNGYLDYRSVPFDQAAHPTGGFFLDQTPRDRSELIEYSFDQSPALTVPRDWNSQDAKLLYYEGTVWYRRRFDAPASAPDGRLWLYFGAANYESDVYLNGHKLGHHIGGFTPFAYEVSGKVLPKANSLVVRVNNRRLREAVPTLNTDWWNYGGLTRDVLLLETPATFISEFSVQLKKGDPATVAVTCRLDGPRPRQRIMVSLPEAGLSGEGVGDERGRVAIELPAAGLERWSPQSPRLYGVKIGCETDTIEDRIGFRTIEVRGDEILLNGKPVFLRGVSLHEENPLRGGRACTVEDARLLLTWAKELHCNFVRLAHYPHTEFMARLADEMGILVWEEIPVYWTIAWDNPATLANARAQLADVIDRDRNRASVIVWSVANETPVSEPRTRFLKTLVDDARSRDGTRLVSAAMELRADPARPNEKIVDDPFGAYTDLISFNEYIGWYDGLPDKLASISWAIKYRKPVVISEFGGDALAGFHADALTRFSEEYQRDLYIKTLAMLRRIPQLRGMTPWVLCDFRSPRRLLPNVEDGFNRKGLIGENGAKKEAFFTLRSFYDEVAARP